MSEPSRAPFSPLVGLALLTSALAASPVQAQGPGQMPDLRTMSGRPLTRTRVSVPAAAAT